MAYVEEVRCSGMKLIKLNKLEDLVTAENAEVIYFNADNIVSVRQTSEYSEVEIVYPYGLRRVKVQETIEEIQYQLEDKPINKPRVGVRIKEIRLEKGMTTKEFGSLFGASDSNVTSWEKGRTLPNKERLKSIADLAGMTVQQLLEG